MVSEYNMEGSHQVGFTLTQDQFTSAAKNFIEKSDKLYDGWVLEEYKEIPYLKLLLQRKTTKHPKKDYITQVGDRKNDELSNNSAKERDCAALNINTEFDFVFLEYHVIYSVSYSVPVLYIRGYDAFGGMVRIDKLIVDGGLAPNQQNEAEIHKESEDTGMNITSGEIRDNSPSLADFVKPGSFSQCSHPLLFEPFYQLHPCHTAQWMETMCTVKNAKENFKRQIHVSVGTYIIIWLSFVGPFVGLSIDNKYMLL